MKYLETRDCSRTFPTLSGIISFSNIQRYERKPPFEIITE